MMKRNLSILLALLLCMGLLPMQVQAAGIPFTDVPTGAWYYADVKNAYESGLINGKNPTTFAPNDNMVYAEAIKLAACMHQKYTTGKVTLQNGSPWYQTYVDYALQNRIITREYDWNAQATRAGYMEIFAGALPEEAMKQINAVQDGSIPDVPMTHVQAKAIYKLYRVGILQGNDEAHSCNPGGAIIRGEVAAILTRMMDSSKRVTFTLGETPKKLTITQEVEDEVIVAAGDKVIATVGVGGGSGKYTYQWQYRTASGDWKNIPGGTEATLTHTPSDTQLTKDLEYRCVIKDSTGAQVTTKSLTTRKPEVPQELAILSQPEDVTAAAGDTVSFSVEVKGGQGPYTYRWYYINDDGGSLDLDLYKNDFEGFDHDGSISTVSGVVNATDQKNGFHVRVRVTDAEGNAVLSDVASVNWKAKTAPLTIVSQPLDVTAAAGEQVSFSVEVEGGQGPYTYRWYYINDDGGSLDLNLYKSDFEGFDSNKNTCVVSGVVNATDRKNGFNVRVRVTDAEGQAVLSEVASVNWKAEQPKNDFRFYTQPKSIEIAPGGEAKFEVEIEGGQYPYSFQWQAYGGVWADVRHVANVSIDVDEGYGISLLKTKDASLAEHPMRVIVTDKNGNQLITEEFQFTIKKEPLIITTQPEDVATDANSSGSFTAAYSVAVSGGRTPYTYQWQYRTSTKGWANILSTDTWANPGTIKSNALLVGARNSNMLTSGYQFRCVITDGAGNSVTSDGAKLTAKTPPLSATIGVWGSEGHRAMLGCRVSGGTKSYTYQWYKNGSLLSGQTEEFIWVSKSNVGQNTYYYCVVKDAAGKTVTTNSIYGSDIVW